MITVHLTLSGTKVFHGPTYEEARRAAESWITMAGEGQRKEEEQDAPPNGISPRCWASYCGPGAGRIAQVLHDAAGAPMTTGAISEAARLSRPSVTRILTAMLALDEARQVGEMGQGKVALWVAA